MCQLDNFLACWIGQRPAIYVDAAQLVDATVTGRRATEEGGTLTDHRSAMVTTGVHDALCKMKRFCVRDKTVPRTPPQNIR